MIVSVYLVYIKQITVHQPRMIALGVIVSSLSFELCNFSTIDSVLLKAFLKFIFFPRPQPANHYNYDFHWLFFFPSRDHSYISPLCKGIQLQEHLFPHMPVSLLCVFSLFSIFLFCLPFFRDNIVTWNEGSFK